MIDFPTFFLKGRVGASSAGVGLRPLELEPAAPALAVAFAFAFALLFPFAAGVFTVVGAAAAIFLDVGAAAAETRRRERAQTYPGIRRRRENVYQGVCSYVARAALAARFCGAFLKEITTMSTSDGNATR